MNANITLPDHITPLNIAFIASEVAPITKLGGVADVIWALPRSLARLGNNVRIISPKFGSTDLANTDFKYYKKNLSIKTEKKVIQFNILKGHIPDNLEVYLIENKEFYDLRYNVYGYKDDANRFAFLCKAALELINMEDWNLDILHANDWMTGYLCDYLKNEYKFNAKLNKIASVFTIHNLAMQGINKAKLNHTNIDQGNSVLPDLLDEKFNQYNGMLRGIINADYINTVSETYAKEILTQENGEGLDKVLQELRSKLTGIRNGLDYEVMNPETDKNIYVNFNSSTIYKKTQNKLAFQKEFDLEINADIPLVGFVGRFTEQKGLGLFHDTLRPLLDNMNFQFAIVGGNAGEGDYWVKYFVKLMKEYPKRVGGYLLISTTFAQKLYAACDIFIAPSKFEPCGITHAIAMRFGAVPLVRETGGLADSVIDYNRNKRQGYGFMFKEYKDMALLVTLTKALTIYETNKPVWNKIQNRAMTKDLSWTMSAIEYMILYDRAIDRHTKWLKKEKIIPAQFPIEAPGYLEDDVLS